MKKTVLVLSGLLWAAICFGQFTLKGSVEDENGQPLPGVSIIELDSKKGTFSDENGQFVLNRAATHDSFDKRVTLPCRLHDFYPFPTTKTLSSPGVEWKTKTTASTTDIRNHCIA